MTKWIYRWWNRVEESGDLRLDHVHRRLYRSPREVDGRSREDEDRTLRSRSATQDSEWENKQRVRTEELVASHDAIKLLNDECVELFKETLPSPALTGLGNNR